MKAIQEQIDNIHIANDHVIDMMNEGELSIREAKSLLKINADNIERLKTELKLETERI